MLRCTTPLLTLVLSTLVVHADAHAYMAMPPSRNIRAADSNAWCPQCGNAGGAYAVNARIVAIDGFFPRGAPEPEQEGTHGLCGDPWQTTSADVPAIDVQTHMRRSDMHETVYIEGQEIDISVVVTAAHGGFLEFRICDEGLSEHTPSQTAGQQCLDKHVLQRVDPLERSECQDPTTRPYDCHPLDPMYPSRWYFPPGAGTFYMRFRLPDGLTCSACTMQMWWMTGNSCRLVGEESYFELTFTPWAGHMSWTNRVLPTCSTRRAGCANGACGEQFWNCADIRIVPHDHALSSTTPPPSPTPIPAPVAIVMSTEIEIQPPFMPLESLESLQPTPHTVTESKTTTPAAPHTPPSQPPAATSPPTAPPEEPPAPPNVPSAQSSSSLLLFWKTGITANATDTSDTMTAAIVSFCTRMLDLIHGPPQTTT